MIRYALLCDQEHRFEAWFSNSAAFDEQNDRGLVECPQCGSVTVRKAVMSPAVSTSRKRDATPEAKLKAMASQVKAHIRNNFDYVGEDFAAEARAIHAGDKPDRLIYGETSPEEGEALREEGVPVAPLPDALAPTPPKKAN
ncbi:DUF1178 family protein [uncultured Maricaulis sp.]|mgnify:FL=1|jgi:hypothetical protein|uniref:DUF1178 family protein n=1 Tax=uncultured Maricaulis sp. TaxID=174710 RepID=UPI0030DA1CF8|tara:strand:+ start:11357 stop:11779 length:423 start_codon:yes stop_codon:yes gene_type:complete